MRKILLTALLLGLVFPATASAGLQRTEKLPFYGFSDYRDPCGKKPDSTSCIGKRDFRLFSLDGIQRPFVYRIPLYQSRIESGALTWDDYRQTVADVRAAGGVPMAVIAYKVSIGPRVLVGGRLQPALQPVPSGSIANFTAEALRQLPGLKTFQIYNEPNGGGGWISASQYVSTFYCPAANAVQTSGRSDVQVFTAGLATPDPSNTNTHSVKELQNYARQMMRAIVSSCPSAPIGGVALHPYARSATGTAQTLNAIRRAVTIEYSEELPLYITEWGFPSKALMAEAPASYTTAQKQAFGESQQQKLILDGSRWMAKQRSLGCMVSGAWWFGIREGMPFGDDSLALLRNESAPKPAYQGMMDAIRGVFSRSPSGPSTNYGVNQGGCRRKARKSLLSFDSQFNVPAVPPIVTDQEAWIQYGWYGNYVQSDGRKKIVIRPGQVVTFTAPGASSCAWDIGNKGSANYWTCSMRHRFPNPGLHVVKLVADGGVAFYDVYVDGWPPSGYAVAIPTTSASFVPYGASVALYSYGPQSTSYVVNGSATQCAWDIGDKGSADYWGCDTKWHRFYSDTKVKLCVIGQGEHTKGCGYIWIRVNNTAGAASSRPDGSGDYDD